MTPIMQTLMVLVHGKLRISEGLPLKASCLARWRSCQPTKGTAGLPVNRNVGADGQRTGMWVQGRVACCSSILAAGSQHNALLV